MQNNYSIIELISLLLYIPLGTIEALVIAIVIIIVLDKIKDKI